MVVLRKVFRRGAKESCEDRGNKEILYGATLEFKLMYVLFLSRILKEC